MYFIRIMLLWYMLVLSVRCYSSSEIPLDRAEQSSTYNTTYIAAKAIDGDLGTRSRTTPENPAWVRVYFSSSSTVGRVVVEKGGHYSKSCVFTVSVCYGEIETVCGTYTGIPLG